MRITLFVSLLTLTAVAGCMKPRTAADPSFSAAPEDSTVAQGVPDESDRSSVEHEPHRKTLGLKVAGEAGIGDKTICIVTGDEFTIEADTDRVEYQGKTYFFCCEDCANEFKASPEKFLRAERAPAAAPVLQQDAL